MIDLETVAPHPIIEEMVDVLCNKIQNNDRPLFRTVVAYFFGKVAASMRTSVVTKDRGELPINCYALLTASSGSGKGYCVDIMENGFLKQFKEVFMNSTFPVISENNLKLLADERSLRSGNSFDEEFDKICTEFKNLGALAFTFDSGTTPAVKQMRQKLLMGEIGSINLQIDEIGANLIGSIDLLNVFLELYDQGQVKQKLTKNTAENQRAEELDGKTPTNMLLFGSPNKLLDGGKTEDEFYAFLETGYARRCLFANGKLKRSAETLNPTEIYQRLCSSVYEGIIQKLAAHFGILADVAKYNQKIRVDDDVSIALLTYKIKCEALADALPEHEEVKKAELSHRYMKALKLAGSLAFVDETPNVTITQLYQAIKLVEDSGISFQQLLNREKSYVKLAKYLAEVTDEVTHADLNIALPFYKTSNAARNEQMSMAMAWGYKNNIIIKKNYYDGIEFFTGETLKETDLDKMIISYSNHVAYKYLSEEVPFTKLGKLFTAPNYHWLNHSLIKGKIGEGHRDGTNIIPGFNLLVLDIDKGISLSLAHELMKEFTFISYTTKRHQTENYGDRFRMILPMKYTLKLDEAEFNEFMQNVYSWLPFEVDEETAQRCRKWECNPGTITTNEGNIFDPLKFIPKTSRNEDYKKSNVQLQNLDNIERWFAERICSGNRNNQLLKFAMMLKDSGLSYIEVEQKLKDFNNKLQSKLDVGELNTTILRTLAKSYSEQ